jgi:hypothetical protein
MSEHMAAKHAAQQPPAKSKKTKPKQPQNQASVGNSLPSLVKQQGSDVASLSGVDRLFHVPDVKDYQDGKLVCDILIEPSAFDRLDVVASAFQRIVYKSLRFKVVTQINTLTSGGYVCAFVRDPSDVMDNGSLNRLTSMRGSVTTKWYQSAIISANSPTSYFTSSGVEIREFSPGRFVLMADGAATQSGSLTIFVEWAVQLSGPSIERVADKTYVTNVDWWNRKGHTGIFYKVGATFADDVATLLPGAKEGDIFRLPSAIATVDGEAYRRFWYVKVKTKDELIPLEDNGDEFAANFTHDNLFMPSGMKLEYVAPAPAGNLLQVRSLESTTAPESLLAPTQTESCSESSTLSLQLKNLETSLTKFSTHFSVALTELTRQSSRRCRELAQSPSRTRLSRSQSMEYLHLSMDN